MMTRFLLLIFMGKLQRVLVEEAVTYSTNVDNAVLDNGVAVELSLAGREQLPPFVWGTLVVLQ